MRIIAGSYKGRTLKAPKGDCTRPTTDRVREAMMSSLLSVWGSFENARVLDAFAGSGALGFEALSRGAASALFYEKDKGAFRTLMDNARSLGLEKPRVMLRQRDFFKTLPSAEGGRFDLVFLDPPYSLDTRIVLDALLTLCAREVLSAHALVVYEHAENSCKQLDKAVASCRLTLASHKKYGDTVVDVMNVNASCKQR